MQPVIVSHRLRNLDRTVDIHCHARPAHEHILRAFQAIFRQRLLLVESFSEHPVPLPDFNVARSAHDRAWLSGASLEPVRELLEESARGMLPSMAVAFPAGDVFKGMETLLLDPAFDLPATARQFLDGGVGAVDRSAADAGVDPLMLGFAIETVLGPVAALLALSAEGALQDRAWQHGYCPVCGRPPSIAYLARREETGLESLVGGGGQKHLHCSLCDHVWRFRRDACPQCGTFEPKSREVWFAADAQHERIEYCHQCRGYHLSIDLREVEQDPDLLIAPVALMHLDMVARDRGGQPLYVAPWNTFA